VLVDVRAKRHFQLVDFSMDHEVRGHSRIAPRRFRAQYNRVIRSWHCGQNFLEDGIPENLRVVYGRRNRRCSHMPHCNSKQTEA
jgi:hypothetical protein